MTVAYLDSVMQRDYATSRLSADELPVCDEAYTGSGAFATASSLSLSSERGHLCCLSPSPAPFAGR